MHTPWHRLFEATKMEKLTPRALSSIIAWYGNAVTALTL